ncbi:hypothetical protein PVK06_029664 [Gossypium arboreum]|uniref:Uncharacterized protein n=1 Tax=Gossypium arboreum TaxID=29729 RepID=A0ABR0NL59_GOSAR|nr:hypothetical protein PVK06_029664 [Gossypium arboreum]
MEGTSISRVHPSPVAPYWGWLGRDAKALNLPKDVSHLFPEIEKLNQTQKNLMIGSLLHVPTEYAVFSVFETGALGRLRTYWTRVWMAYGVRGPFSEFFGHMRSETAIFPRFLRVGSVGWSWDLAVWAHARFPQAGL